MNRDRLSRERRSWNMSRIRGKHTTPEKIVRSALHRMGFRFRLHRRIPIESFSASRVRHSAPDDGGSSSSSSLRRAVTSSSFSFSFSSSIRKTNSNHQLSTNLYQPLRRHFITPDIVLVKHRVAIFVHGCFWHRHRGCRNCTTPTNRQAWWLKKLNGNAARDALHARALRKLGWNVIVIWECQTEKPTFAQKLAKLMARNRSFQAKGDRIGF